MKKFLVALVFATLFSIGAVGVASAHSGTPAWKCHTQIAVELAAISTRNNANIGAASAALAACEGVTSVAPTTTVTPFNYGFPSSNSGFFNPFNFGNNFSFGTGTNFGYGLNSSIHCPAGSGLVQGAPLPAATYTCVFGVSGFGTFLLCGGEYHPIETIVAPEPVYQCVL